MRRCPPLAITDKGKDNEICEEYIGREILSRFAPRYGCAKCSLQLLPVKLCKYDIVIIS
ncbi:hypothetical protein [Clostridium botulinum]|uniref:hypothetical protein n=1 Tax=Clostridium botulinum TaxID=1491 RepID=UPI001CEDB940|nr:hypothetical protein [Clostridium botulinum]